jgi:DNA repair protein RecN (Recombination protein N)
MLSTLSVSNLAVIEQAEIEFGPGLNVLTGETGAGKSMILRAIDLITGRRATAEMIRQGADSCEVQALFTLSPLTISRIGEAIDEYDGDEELLIRRTVERSGRGKIYVNGRLATAGLLQRLAGFLIDITGQLEQIDLLEPETQRDHLDEFGVNPSAITDTAELYARWRETAESFDRLTRDRAGRDRYLAGLRSEFDELSRAELQVGEKERLHATAKRLASSETITSLISQSIAVFDADEGLDTLLGRIGSALDQAARLDPALEAIRSQYDSATSQVGELRLEFERYLAALDADPEKLEQLRERVAEISRLERKFGRSEAELVEYFNEIAAELETSDDSPENQARLEAEVVRLRAELNAAEVRLTTERRKAATALSKVVENDLKLLNMPKARFSVEVQPAESSRHGADRIEFLLAANPNDQLRPIAKVASGGELSRILLVLKTALNAAARTETQIFDEVDAGIGGAVAHAVGERLKRLAANGQIILVTHSPQIAAFGETHLLIRKDLTDTAARTTIDLLPEKGRIGEIARMLAGKEITVEFEESARKLLGLGQKPKKERRAST